MASQSVALTAAIIRGHAGAMKPAAHLHDALRAQLRPIHPHKMDAHPGAAPARYLVFTARNKGLSGPNSPHRQPGAWPGPSWIQSMHASPSPPISPREAAPVAKGADAPTAAAASEGVAAGGAGAGGNMIKKRGGCLASHLHRNVYMCVCVCVSLSLSLSVCVCICKYMCMYTHIHTYTCTLMHTYARTHTHTHMHMYVYVAYEYRRELGVASAQEHAGQSPAQKDEAVGSD